MANKRQNLLDSLEALTGQELMNLQYKKPNIYYSYDGFNFKISNCDCIDQFKENFNHFIENEPFAYFIITHDIDKSGYLRLLVRNVKLAEIKCRKYEGTNLFLACFYSRNHFGISLFSQIPKP